MADFIFGEIDIKRPRYRHLDPPRRLTPVRLVHRRLNPDNPLVSAIFAFSPLVIEEVRKALAESPSASSAQTEQAKRLQQEASAVRGDHQPGLRGLPQAVAEGEGGCCEGGVRCKRSAGIRPRGMRAETTTFFLGGDEPASIVGEGEQGVRAVKAQAARAESLGA